MSETPAYPTIRDVYELVDEATTKIGNRLDKQDDRLDGAVSRLDRIEGAVNVIKWLGPVGLAALLYGVLKGGGFMP